ncbi:MAG: phytanoyl-CoA dioxygenase family protein [Planctomycetota bacterium]|jgi:hypothetical protein|nr:phytanoyl-CoA dioxygenase family protein [Planctomycetota bacterium]
MQIDHFIESNDIIDNPPALRARLRQKGYLFFRDIFPREDVLTLRRQTLELCDEAGWLKTDTDLMDGITDHEPMLEGQEAWQPVYEKLNKLETFHRLKLHPSALSVMARIFEEEAFALPRSIARIAFPRDNDRITQPHQDWFYVRGSLDTISCWAPMGDIPAEVGGLMLLEGSHKAGILPTRPAQGPGGNSVVTDPDLRWLAVDYQAGDALFFNSLTIHGARPNQTVDRLRLSVDYRYVGISHAVAADWLLPHYSWLGDRFSWDNLDRDWQDQSLRRYWERGPQIKTVPGYRFSVREE